MTNAQIKILENAINKYGSRFQEDICIEEMGELIQAIVKYRRHQNSKRKNNIIEEMADVTICLEYLKLIHNISDEDINKMIEYKIMRTDRRIRNGDDNA